MGQGKKKNQSDALSEGVFHIMREFGSYKLSDIFSDDFTLPQYVELVNMIAEYYKEKERVEKEAMKGKKK